MSDRDWFESLFIKAADHFGKIHSKQFSDWETGLIKRAVEGGLLKLDKDKISVSTKKDSPYSMFTINREYFIQFAAFASLVYEYDYPPENCLIEYNDMDIMVEKNGKPFICVETKVRDSEIDSLLKGINKCSNSVAPVPVNTRNDALQKANYLIKHKPDFFWILSANKRLAFSVNYLGAGFSLSPVDDIPKYKKG